MSGFIGWVPNNDHSPASRGPKYSKHSDLPGPSLTGKSCLSSHRFPPNSAMYRKYKPSGAYSSCSKIQTCLLLSANSHWGWGLPATAKDIPVCHRRLSWSWKTGWNPRYSGNMHPKRVTSLEYLHVLFAAAVHTRDRPQDNIQGNSSSVKTCDWGWVSWSLCWCGSCCKLMIQGDSGSLILAYLDLYPPFGVLELWPDTKMYYSGQVLVCL